MHWALFCIVSLHKCTINNKIKKPTISSNPFFLIFRAYHKITLYLELKYTPFNFFQLFQVHYDVQNEDSITFVPLNTDIDRTQMELCSSSTTLLIQLRPFTVYCW